MHLTRFLIKVAVASWLLSGSSAFAQTINGLTASPPGLSQAFAQIGAGEFTLTVNGSGFSSNSVVRFASSSLATAPDAVSPTTKLTAVVPASLLRDPGTFEITVANGSAASNAVNFRVVARGDVNADSEVRIGDALGIARSSVGLTKPPLPLSLVDLNFDNNAIVIGDALSLARFSVGLVTNFVLPSISSATTSGGNATFTSNNAVFSPVTANNVIFFSRSGGGFDSAAASSVSTDLKQITVPIPSEAVSGPVFLKRRDYGMPGNPFILNLSGSAAPVYIADVTPNGGLVPGMSSITITGSGFSTLNEQNVVRFTSSISSTVAAGVTTFGAAALIEGVVTAATATSLTVSVPAEAISGFVSVTVGNQTSNKKSILVSGTSSPVLLNHVAYLDAPGESILIEGVGFNHIVPADNKVYFKNAAGADVEGTIVAAGRTQLIVLTPADAVSGSIRLETTARTRVSPNVNYTTGDSVGGGPGSVQLVLNAPDVANDIGAYQVTIQFDPKVVSVDPANVSGGTTAGFGTPLVVNADNIGGTLTVAHFTTTPARPGTFVLARIRFSAVGNGTSPLTIESGSVVVTDKDGKSYDTGAVLSLTPAQLTATSGAFQ